MFFRKLEKNSADFSGLLELLNLYKQDIGEPSLTAAQKDSLAAAISSSLIQFYVVENQNELIAMCSVCRTFSTYSCKEGGVFEDFFIKSEYRKHGIAKSLAEYVFAECKRDGIAALWVGCADCDIDMYKHIGFSTRIGNLLTWINDSETMDIDFGD